MHILEEKIVSKIQSRDSALQSGFISEFTYLKIIALIMLLFVHSDLIFTNPEIIYPIQWLLLSAFFFISGFLVYDSFRHRNHSIRLFFKSKIKSLYFPFVVAVIFYFAVEVALGVNPNFIALSTQISMLNVIDGINAIYNWSSLWFIPYLLAFMLIICLSEKYIKSTKIQLLIISIIWLSSVLLWTYDVPIKLGLLFSQFLPVFTFGFYINKLKIYEKIMNLKMASVCIPLVVFFAFDFSGSFNYNSVLEAFKAQLYWNSRSIILSVGLVLLILFVLKNLKTPKNGFAKQIARRSAFIYLFEPFISFLILTYVFTVPESVLLTTGGFYIYQLVRIVLLLFALPLILIAWNAFYKKKISPMSLLLRG